MEFYAAVRRSVYVEDLDEAFRKRLLLPGGQRGLVLNGVRDTAQEIGIAHLVTERAWKLRNRVLQRNSDHHRA